MKERVRGRTRLRVRVMKESKRENKIKGEEDERESKRENKLQGEGDGRESKRENKLQGEGDGREPKILRQ